MLKAPEGDVLHTKGDFTACICILLLSPWKRLYTDNQAFHYVPFLWHRVSLARRLAVPQQHNAHAPK